MAELRGWPGRHPTLHDYSWRVPKSVGQFEVADEQTVTDIEAVQVETGMDWTSAPSRRSASSPMGTAWASLIAVASGRYSRSNQKLRKTVWSQVKSDVGGRTTLLARLFGGRLTELRQGLLDVRCRAPVVGQLGQRRRHGAGVAQGGV